MLSAVLVKHWAELDIGDFLAMKLELLYNPSFLDVRYLEKVTLTHIRCQVLPALSSP